MYVLVIFAWNVAITNCYNILVHIDGNIIVISNLLLIIEFIYVLLYMNDVKNE